MRSLLLVTSLLIPAKALAACETPRVYTNADIGKSAAQMCPAPAPSPALRAWLKDHEYRSAPTYEGPTVSLASTDTTAAGGPWTWPTPRPARRLDGTLLSQPPTVYGLPGYRRRR